ncbi:hypothetical protein [Xanthobacter sp. 126]|uniref:hypothetical protein n=1 Tax=Xanthobacter sp. 126 TaxID=1131814 RepID=UPI00045E7CAC|nr:hypothetical protein [Xanthobacter sp. 126]
MSRKYAIDQIVEFAGDFLSPTGLYRIIRALPADGGEPSYKVKGQRELFERVARESQLRELLQ